MKTNTGNSNPHIQFSSLNKKFIFFVSYKLKHNIMGAKAKFYCDTLNSWLGFRIRIIESLCIKHQKIAVLREDNRPVENMFLRSGALVPSLPWLLPHKRDRTRGSASVAVRPSSAQPAADSGRSDQAPSDFLSEPNTRQTHCEVLLTMTNSWKRTRPLSTVHFEQEFTRT